MVGGYANAWRTTGEHSTDVEPDEYSETIAEWLALHDEPSQACAQNRRTFVVGGCCGIFPEHIARIRDVLDAASTCSTP